MYFDGKLGIWPFAEIVLAKRTSRNRKKGTPELKPVVSVTKEKVRSMILERIVPAIIDKFPRRVEGGFTPTVWIQQDNAGPHINPDDKAFLDKVRGIDGLLIKLEAQPPMSPDLNVLDLGFFNSLQSLHYKNLQNV